jgi:FkbM family methyltransferase
VSAPFVSYAQNGEDVVLWRALKHVERGRYVDVGANDPRQDSVSQAFYDRGWRGIDVEPVAELAEALRRERPDDVVSQTAVTDRGGAEVVLHEVPGTGLSTLSPGIAESHAERGYGTRQTTVPASTLDDLLDAAGWAGLDIHFLNIDVEGAEREVLRSVDLRRWRPWVLVIEATSPNSAEQTHGEWEAGLLECGYQFCLFDGVSRYYVAQEHADLAPLLSYPACALDDFVRFGDQRLREQLTDAAQRLAEVEAERDRLASELVRWRGAVLSRWTEALAGRGATAADEGLLRHAQHLEKQLDAIQATVSWRVTAPLRIVRRLARRGTAA